jgi:16S rRNA (guanine527-N7)-methyltransferase
MLEAALDVVRKKAPLVGATLTESQIELLGVFLSELAAYNEHTNLVSNADPLVVAREHVLDSLSLCACLTDLNSSCRLVDIGTGAGFPAIVLAIALPNLAVLAIESVGKKTRFLQSLADRLNISQRLEVANERAESLAYDPSLRGSFDIATARAVGKIDVIAELALPFLKTGGRLLAQKSQAQLDEERRRAAIALPVLGGELTEIVIPNVEALEREHVVLIVCKKSATPKQFPRTPVQIKRMPLAE